METIYFTLLRTITGLGEGHHLLIFFHYIVHTTTVPDTSRSLGHFPYPQNLALQMEGQLLPHHAHTDNATQLLPHG
jgi:hypothetical protein